ncbi:TIGR04282 family arsenosugar biosynthesis glycosyltransferase [Algoriphagus halophytocola]|uniref:TIGR04282 family arsenosugar biosynthesis glycosyltransferase n=1 Tax=Algoriphagus halophytocola TaxID=2991499 RepID=A0ABY6MHR6_9BACT|nr:TIGR04282 family arsenosugar biosynthesis glycosyltransferase [Algoriphagus sp. TR-M5]UZD23163.1 TIGR04282 family arsenosugar biosynthesis glycosyltransferase [Algoriphagus sp. TR-M5]
MNTEALLIFQKNAELGKVKTRLAAGIGEEEALQVYFQLCGFTHSIAQQCEMSKKLYFSNYIEGDSAGYGDEYQFEVQTGQDLGEKMSNAFRETFAQGFERVVIIGTDCPELSPQVINQAFAELRHNDAVIGPAKDGGYYLLGMSRYLPGVFEGIPWSTEQVTKLTTDFLQNNEHPFVLLPVLSDVDYEEDWRRFEQKLRKFKTMY